AVRWAGGGEAGGDTEVQTDGQGGAVRVYHVHTPFDPPNTEQTSATQVPIVFTGAAGGLGSAADNSEGRQKYVSYDRSLGRSPGMATCPTCQKQVMTEVSYEAGRFAWLMCLLFICCGLILLCCLIPFFVKTFKDVVHTCPNCKRVLHVEKKKCCQ
ncbi:unnamed protein product, partial [Menidia menidia]